MTIVLTKTVPSRALPFTQPHPYYVLIEAEGANETAVKKPMAHLLEELSRKGLVADGVVAQNESQCDDLWAFRELIPSLLGTNTMLAYDLTLPLDQFYPIVDVVRQKLQKGGLYTGPSNPQSPVEFVSGLGHFSDGNLHLLISVRSAEQQVLECVEPFIYDWTSKYPTPVWIAKAN
ncbi:D-lactate ferricytochrome c oxidoreductase [Dimargaris xerosporica]|nr:D-lactate ferricytochrome c oxidoreductase [Dimargaris xerosporica]